MLNGEGEPEYRRNEVITERHTNEFYDKPPFDNRKLAAKWKPGMFAIAPSLLLGLGSVVVPREGSSPLISALTGRANTASKLTIIARADGTFDIKEFPKGDQWFAPEVIGEGLKITAAQRFGAKVSPSTLDVVVQVDPGASDRVVVAAHASARDSGFVRFGFVDPRLGEVVKAFAATSLTVTSL